MMAGLVRVWASDKVRGQACYCRAASSCRRTHHCDSTLLHGRDEVLGRLEHKNSRLTNSLVVEPAVAVYEEAAVIRRACVRCRRCRGRQWQAVCDVLIVPEWSLCSVDNDFQDSGDQQHDEDDTEVELHRHSRLALCCTILRQTQACGSTQQYQCDGPATHHIAIVL